MSISILTLVSAETQAQARPGPTGHVHTQIAPQHPVARGALTAQKATPGSPLPTKTGTVAVRRTQTVRPARPALKAGTASTLSAATASTTGTQVALRALVVSVDADDWGVATWKSTLERVGAAYDVLYTKTTPLTSTTLVRPDGVGRYNAILLTSGMLLYADGSGGYASGLDANEWNLLWAYERDYGVRQATLYTSYGSWPEDYCLSGSSEGGVGMTPLNATLTATGAGIFDYLTPGATVPIIQSYVYRTRVTAGCAGQPVLTAGADVLGVQSTSTDGRQRLALTFTSNQYLMQSSLLTYGLFRWASRGLFLGEQRHFLEVDVDDWFNNADHRFPDGHFENNPGFQVSGHDVYNLNTQQTALRGRYPQANTFTMTLAFNGGDADLTAGNTCSPNGGINTLTATTRCLKDNFRWINHTLTHPKMNFTDYATSRAEMANNFTVGTTLGLSAPANVVKTGEYSGLGVYNPNPNDDIGPPTDYGLGASNPNLLTAARDLGVQYLHGNMSFPSHVPSCFNCGITHPMEPSVTIVPDWPTNIAYFCTTPDEEASFYNYYYGPGGLFPYWPANLTYSQMLDYETDVALGHVATGSLYAHTFHIANVRDYGSGNTLLTDWLDRVLAKYTAYYSVPLLNPAWGSLAGYAKARIGHFAELAGNVDAVYDPGAGTVRVTSPLAGTVTVTGALANGYTTYGTDRSGAVTLTAGGSVTVPAGPLP